MRSRQPPDVAYFGGPNIPPPPPQPAITFPDFPPIEFPEIEFPEPFDPEAAETKRKRAEEIKAFKEIQLRRKGYASTLLTGGPGVEEEARVNRPSLLGR